MVLGVLPQCVISTSYTGGGVLQDNPFLLVTLRRGSAPARLLSPLFCTRYTEKCGVATTRCIP